LYSIPLPTMAQLGRGNKYHDDSMNNKSIILIIMLLSIADLAQASTLTERTAAYSRYRNADGSYTLILGETNVWNGSEYRPMEELTKIVSLSYSGGQITINSSYFRRTYDIMISVNNVEYKLPSYAKASGINNTLQATDRLSSWKFDLSISGIPAGARGNINYLKLVENSSSGDPHGLDVFYNDLVESGFNVSRSGTNVTISNLGSGKSSIILDPVITLNETNKGNVGDSYVSSALNQGDINYGSSTALLVKALKFTSARTFTLWNLSVVPAGSTITNANLSLYMSTAPTLSRTYNASNTSLMYCPDLVEGCIPEQYLPWDETVITWNNQPMENVTLQQSISTGTTSNVWLSWNVTNAAVSSFAQANKNMSIRIIDSAETSLTAYSAYFYSKENTTDTTKRPRLVITYTTPAPPFNPTILITQNAPADSSTNASRTINYTYTPTWYDSAVKNCSIWDNSTGSWALLKSNMSTTLTNNTLTNITWTYSQDYSVLKWAVQCCNSTNSCNMTGNRTLAIHTVAPTYSSNSTNSTLAGTPVMHSLYWQDTVSLSGYIFSFDNCTGTLVNSSWVAMTGTGNWSNVTKTINSTVGCTIIWCVYANDTSNNWNSTSCTTPFNYTTTDTAPPTYSSNSTNSTFAGTSVLHSLNWTDNIGLSGYIFSFDNCTGTMVNDSWVNMSGTGNWSNVTKTINSTVGCIIRWCVYANDTSNNWNSTSCTTPFNYTTTDTAPPTYSSNSTNSTQAGTPVKHNLYWQDNANLSGYIFSFDNCTGTLVDSSWVAMTGTGNWSNVTKTINSTVGCTIRWCVKANDTSNNWNRTSCLNPFTYTTTAPPSSNYSQNCLSQGSCGCSTSRCSPSTDCYLSDACSYSCPAPYSHSTSTSNNCTPSKSGCGCSGSEPMNWSAPTYAPFTSYLSNPPICDPGNPDCDPENPTPPDPGEPTVYCAGSCSCYVSGSCSYSCDTNYVWDGSNCVLASVDSTPPTYSSNSTNSTLLGTPVKHNLYWQDNRGLSGYIFSFDNCTGHLVNSSWVAMTGTGNWSNVTKTINSTVGCIIRWCVYANDTSNNWNSTSCTTPFNYTTTAPPANPPALVSSDRTNYTACGAVFYRVGLYDKNSELISSYFTSNVLNPSLVTVYSQSSLYPNNGTGIYKGNFTLNTTSPPGTWLLKILENGGATFGKNFFVAATCGDGTCTAGETCSSCPADCGTCTTYYQNTTYLCGYQTTIVAGCGSGLTTTYCSSGTYFPTQACSLSGYTSCQSQTSSASCAVCGNCSGSSDTCNPAVCGTTNSYGCGSGKYCGGTIGNCQSPFANGLNCNCSEQCNSGFCSGGVCIAYYQSGTNLCGYHQGPSPSCGAANNFCAAGTYYPTQSCSSSPTYTACISQTSSASCAVCGNCTGGSDTCNAVACGTTNSYGCGSGYYCSGGKGVGSCNAPFGSGVACNCSAQCSSGTCSFGLCALPTCTGVNGPCDTNCTCPHLARYCCPDGTCTSSEFCTAPQD